MVSEKCLKLAQRKIKDLELTTDIKNSVITRELDNISFILWKYGHVFDEHKDDVEEIAQELEKDNFDNALDKAKRLELVFLKNALDEVIDCEKEK